MLRAKLAGLVCGASIKVWRSSRTFTFSGLTNCILEVAHIKPYAEDGPHCVNNGLLLKSDFHTLFDGGYITIDKDYHIDVSKRLYEDYGNGKDYYKYHGEKLLIFPEKQIELPSKEYLEWHNEYVFLG